MSESKHSWSYEELRIACICYKENLPISLALKLTNTTNAKSMEMRYANCLFLDKGRVDGALSHASKNLVKAWEDVQMLYELEPEPESESESESEPVVTKPKEEPFDLCSALIVVFTIMIFWSGLVHKNGI